MLHNNINTEIESKTLEDLPKLNLLMESCNLKVIKSQLARGLNVYMIISNKNNSYN